MRSDYPEFVFEQTDQAHPGFVKIITDAVKKLDFDGPRFSDVGQKFLRGIRQVGSHVIYPAIQEVDQEQNSRGPNHYLDAVCLVGDAVFEEIPKDDLIKFVPWNNVDIVPHGRVIRVIFQSLIETSEGNFYSRLKPMIICPDGKERMVAFSRHSADRVLERVSSNWLNYRGLADAFSRFARCVFFEPARLRSGGFAFTFFDRCPLGFWEDCFVRALLGDIQNSKQNNFYYRLGYCPAEYESKSAFVTATSFLYPGYADTPEAEIIALAKINNAEKKQLLFRAQHDTPRRYLERTSDLMVIKWLHEHGLQQLFQFPFKVYNDSPLQPRPKK